MKKYKCILQVIPFSSCEVDATTMGEAQVKAFHLLRGEIPSSHYFVVTDINVEDIEMVAKKEEQKRILAHIKYMHSLGQQDRVLEKAINLIDELMEEIEGLKSK